MMGNLHPGERIRLTAQVRHSAFRPGQRGIILSGYRASDKGWLSYYVRMQGQAIGTWTFFAAYEVERDSAQGTSVRPDAHDTAS